MYGWILACAQCIPCLLLFLSDQSNCRPGIKYECAKYLFDLKETALNAFKGSITQSLCNIMSGESIDLKINVSEGMLSAFFT